jgi:hypothetical protein
LAARPWNASFCAEPYGGKKSVLGEITMDDIKITAMSPEQRCTVASVAGHAMYERPNPFHEYFIGGHIDMSHAGTSSTTTALPASPGRDTFPPPNCAPSSKAPAS